MSNAIHVNFVIVQGVLPAEYTISVITTENALQPIKINKAMGPDNIPACILRGNASILAAPITAIFNISLREGCIPAMWKAANVVPLPKRNPPRLIEKDIRPISRTPIVSKGVRINSYDTGGSNTRR